MLCSLLMLTGLLLLFSPNPSQSAECRKIVVVPLDGRNRTYDYVRRIIGICGYEPELPPWEMMGNISDYESSFLKQWNIWIWLDRTLDDRCSLLILSADSFIYGGLLESRSSPITTEKALLNAALLKQIRQKYPHIKILVFSSIPRKEADLVRAVNHPSEARAEEDFLLRIVDLIAQKPLTTGDLSSRNESTRFFQKLFAKGLFPRLAGYANWGMGTNTLATSLCEGCARIYCPDEASCEKHFAFLYERMLTDYIYLDLIHMPLASQTELPAYSLKRLEKEQEDQAISLALSGIEKELTRLGIRYEMEKTPSPTNREAPGGFRYIPLPPGEEQEQSGDQMRIRLDIPIENNRYGRQALITCGPISFPFHRLFEIWIPTTCELKQAPGDSVYRL